LSPNFVDWALCDEYGWTIAHQAAAYNHLPKNFSQWDLVEPDTGWTVAHEAAFWGYLPDNFNRWNLVDYNGDTVADVAKQAGYLPKDFKG